MDYLSDFSDEILSHILSFVSARDLCNLAISNKKLSRVTRDEALWEKLFKSVPFWNALPMERYRNLVMFVFYS